jgi:hypothetical protein
MSTTTRMTPLLLLRLEDAPAMCQGTDIAECWSWRPDRPPDPPLGGCGQCAPGQRQHKRVSAATSTTRKRVESGVYGMIESWSCQRASANEWRCRVSSVVRQTGLWPLGQVRSFCLGESTCCHRMSNRCTTCIYVPLWFLEVDQTFSLQFQVLRVNPFRENFYGITAPLGTHGRPKIQLGYPLFFCFSFVT